MLAEEAAVADEPAEARSKVAEEAMDVHAMSQRQAPMIQKVLKTFEVMTQEIVDPVARPYHEYVDVPYANPIVWRSTGAVHGRNR